MLCHRSNVRGSRLERSVQTPQEIGGPWREAVGWATIYQGRERCLAEGQGRDPPTVGEVLQHSPQHEIPQAEPSHHRGGEQRPAAPTTGDSVPLGSAPTLEETRQAIRGMHNWKAPYIYIYGPDSLVAELLKIDEPAEPIVLKRFHAILVEV